MTKRKSWAKVAIVALAVLLCLAIALGITGAWYKAQRNATGTIELDQGIIIDYSGFSANATQTKWGKGVDLLLFEQSTEGILPGETIDINEASIGANADSIDFYARYKLTYKFYSDVEGNTPVDLATPADLITVTGLNGSDWTLSGDGYYYYAADGALKAFKPADGLKALFGTDAAFHIEGPLFVGIEDGEGGAFVVNETTSISRIEVYLTLEALQATEDAVADEAWEITEVEEEEEEQLPFVENLSDFTYTQDDVNKTLTLETYNGDLTEFQVKSTYPVEITGASGLASGLTTEEYTVVEVGYSFDFLKYGVTKVILPETVVKLSCFSYSSTLEYIKAPGVKITNGSGFKNCTALKYVELPKLEIVGSEEFSGCTALETIELSENLDSIGRLAFNGCTNLTSVTLPNTSFFVDTYEAFGNTPFLQNIVENENGIYTSEDGSKYYVKAPSQEITQVDLSGIVSIFGQAFYGCTSLTEVALPNTLKVISHGAFSGCSSLQTVNFETSILERIGTSAFYNTPWLTNLTNGIATATDGVTKYLIQAPSNLTTLDLTGVKAIAASAFSGRDSYTSIIIPEGVKYLEDATFSRTNIASLEIPSSIIYVGAFSLDGAAFTTLTFKSEMPPRFTMEQDHLHIFNSQLLQTVYVPSGCTDAYRAALTKLDSSWGASVTITELPAEA